MHIFVMFVTILLSPVQLKLVHRAITPHLNRSLFFSFHIFRVVGPLLNLYVVRKYASWWHCVLWPKIEHNARICDWVLARPPRLPIYTIAAIALPLGLAPK